ncbi:hypothetical protein [Autumnicola musiva]|uniref:Curlin associated repeat-containing protein n=1 Tax=Autumnicola musiva TaxID=3075589 RepID=A0ABU3DAY1_9FLAO|nr:hypothetical protein [Zunongwangia sp. F117]MDT0678123.1 hypothetical protein [Zunongwangia sp. F117]
MNLIKNISVLGFIYFSASLLAFSQETGRMTSELGHVNKEQQYTIHTFQNLKIAESQIDRVFFQNNIFIEQLGENNFVKSAISSSTGQAKLIQDGMENEIYIDLQAEKVRYNVIQIGNNNYLQDHTYTSYKTAEFNLYQNGNKNEVLKYGTNSITNQLEFNIKGDSKSLIIRSYQ